MDTSKFEKIQKEFITEVQAILSHKKIEMELYSGKEQATVKLFHLDNIHQFAKILNIKINRIVDENKLVFKTQKEGDEFSEFMKSTFEKFHKGYADLANP
ncbi:hypothetical protein [uncultured Flavobacterium sp.]|uniref:hypothetical protein n=1 Tax=uncultured Flavobacterium sp. TaxID=165435 RepID=UPI0025941F49|nr:hypothetical protein [uncultured Flavobacterium sp.]